MRDTLELYFREIVVKKRDRWFGMSDLYFCLTQLVNHKDFPFLRQFLNKLRPFILSDTSDFHTLHMSEKKNYITLLARSRLFLLQRLIRKSEHLLKRDIRRYGIMAARWFSVSRMSDLLFYNRTGQTKKENAVLNWIRSNRNLLVSSNAPSLIRRIFPLLAAQEQNRLNRLLAEME